jgi:hypothetical protein
MDFGPILQNSFGEYYLPSINQEIFSQSGAGSFYSRQFDEGLREKDTLYIIVGSDSGRLLHWVIERGVAEGARYLFIEIPALVTYLQEQADFPRSLPAGVQVCALDQWLRVAEEWSLRDYCYLGQVQPVRSMAVLDGFFEAYTLLWKQFEEQFNDYQALVGREVGSRVFMVKGLENLAENQIAAECLLGTFAGKTAILLAGGPSLPESFAWVKAHRERLHLPRLLFCHRSARYYFSSKQGHARLLATEPAVQCLPFEPPPVGTVAGARAVHGAVVSLGYPPQSHPATLLSWDHRQPSSAGHGHRNGLYPDHPGRV